MRAGHGGQQGTTDTARDVGTDVIRSNPSISVVTEQPPGLGGETTTHLNGEDDWSHLENLQVRPVI